jgi:PAS domain S-box-containing protein
MKDHAVFMVTADGNIKSWNDAAGRVNGYAKDEVFGKSIASFFAPDAQHARSGELLETAEKQGQAEWDGWMVKKDGAWFWAHVCITPLFDNTDALYGYSVVLRDTTENRRTEELLREREELYRTLIETSPAAIVLFDTDSRILMINQQAAALFGFENREDVFGESVFNYIVPEDRQRAREGIAKLSPKGEKNKYYNCLKKDGSHFIGSLSSSIIGDADGKPKLYIGMIIDVTEQWTSEERIRKAAEEWRATFDAINDFIVILDKDMRITRVNKACAAAYHSTPQELLGKHCYEVFHGQNEIPAFCYYGKVIRDKNTVVEELFEPTVGKQLEATVSPIFDKEGNIDGTVHVFKDITERKKIDELLRSEKEAVERLASERTKELVTARIKLEQAKRLSDVGTLAATVAHELRNPLGVIRTAAYNIKRKSQGEGLKGHLANIEKKIIESDQIINNLLFYSRIKMPNYEKVNLCALVEECVASAKDRFHKWSVVVKGHYGGIIDGYIDADPLQIGELFNNIINNAYEALPDKTGMIDIRGGLDGIGNIWVSIKDNGPGIDKEDLGRLTEPFFTKKSKGTGLGLTVCRQIVELHGGKMYIDSQKDAGTTVTISLPVVLRTR